MIKLKPVEKPILKANLQILGYASTGCASTANQANPDACVDAPFYVRYVVNSVLNIAHVKAL